MPRVILAEHDRRSLEAVAERLEAVCISLRGVVANLDVHGIERLEVPNNDQLVRGMGYLEGFAFAARRAMHDVLVARGHYRAQPPPD